MAQGAKDIRSIKEEHCCGCGACVNACPVDAISMKEGAETFLFPEIDQNRCIHCGKCLRACPAAQEAQPVAKTAAQAAAEKAQPEVKTAAQAAAEKAQPGVKTAAGEKGVPRCFAAAAPDAIRLSSSSGGIFRVLADRVLSQKGTVYGAAWGENALFVEHVRITEKQELPRLSGSKYVPSRISFSYRQILKDLEAGRPVLFSGTPCQNAGLLRFLKKPYENLLTADIVCHGVPSEALFHSYLEETYGAEKVSEVRFRTKEFGQNCSHGVVCLKNGKRKVISSAEDPYEQGFHRSLFLRKSCAACPFAPVPRIADFTLGDFWGLEKHSPDLADPKGVSLVLVNTEKGERVWNEVKDGLLLCREMPLEAGTGHNRFRKTIRVSPGRSRFFSLFPALGFSNAVRCAMENRYDVMLAWQGSQEREKLEAQLEAMANDLGRTVCLEGHKDVVWECHAEGLEDLLKGRYPEELDEQETKALEKLLKTRPGIAARGIAAAKKMGAKTARGLFARLGPEKKEAVKALFRHGK